MMKGRFFVGTSGWSYKHWKGVFYPQELSQSKWLKYYSQHFDTVEINNSFYRLPEKETFVAWRKATPPNFIFAVKANRFITHMKKLSQPDLSLSKFFDNSSGLNKKLGPILFQLPPFWNLNLKRFKEFVAALKRQKIIKGMRITLEIRNATWLSEDVYYILKNANISLCFSDWTNLKVEGPVTADFVFIRRHGSSVLYASEYSDEELIKDAKRIRDWLKKGIDVYIYFNNDAYGWATKNARTLLEMIRAL